MEPISPAPKLLQVSRAIVPRFRAKEDRLRCLTRGWVSVNRSLRYPLDRLFSGRFQVAGRRSQVFHKELRSFHSGLRLLLTKLSQIQEQRPAQLVYLKDTR